MGQTAEVLADAFGITRDDQDRRSEISESNAAEQPNAGEPYGSRAGGGAKDNGIRRGQSTEPLAKLRCRCSFKDARSGHARRPRSGWSTAIDVMTRVA